MGEVYKVQLEDLSLKSKEKITIEDNVNSSEFPAGVYDVEVLIEYGKRLVLKDIFRVGVSFVNLTNYDYRFEEGVISKVNVEVENLWNSLMGNVYVKATVSDQGKILDQFQSASLDLEPWGKTNLTGFFDATNISEGKYLMSLNLNYADNSDSKLVYIYVYSIPKDYTLIWIIGSVSLIAIISILVWVFLAFKLHKLIKEKRLKRKEIKNGKK